MYAKTVTLILNNCGKDKDKIITEILAVFGDAGYKVKLVEFSSNSEFCATCDSAVKEAKAENGIVIAAGGDGTVSAIGDLCHKYKVRMGVIPLGTFNYFAREHNIPLQPIEAARAIQNGVEKKVSAGFIGERLFLNNASFGLYTKIIKNREKDKKLFGRFKIVDMISAAHSLFSRQKTFTVNINLNGRQEAHKTTMIFIGNNNLQLENLGLEEVKCTRNDLLGVIIMSKISRWETARLLMRGVLKNMGKEETLDSFCSDSFEIDSERKNIEVALDGEIIKCQTPLLFHVEADALSLIVPAQIKDEKK